MEIKLTFPMLGRMFMMPASVADEYLKISTGDQLKVLISIYCAGSDRVDTERVAQMTGASEQTVREAVIHFSKLGVFSAQGIEGAKPSWEGAVITTESQSAIQTAPKTEDLKLLGQPEAIKGTQRDTSKDSRVHYSPKELAGKIEADPALSALMQDMEGILGTPLKPQNTCDVLEMYEHLEFDPASIQMIAEYCKSLGKRKTAYILKVARDWFEDGVCDFEQVERRIIGMSAYNSLEGKIRRMIGQEGNVTKKQGEFIRSWQDMGFGFEMIELAYEINIDNTGKLSFPYMNKIITGWGEKGIHTPLAAKEEKERFAKSRQDKQHDGSISTRAVDDFAASIDLSKVTT